MRKWIAMVLVAMLCLMMLPAAIAQEETLIVLSDEGITVTGDASAITMDHDIVYYEDRTAYDSGFPYGEGTQSERHSAEEAASHTVVRITKAGTYRVTGDISAGQLWVDLGEGAEEDPTAVVTVILDNASITCSVAPAIVFYQVYECCGGWSTETATSAVDTSAAGANLVLAQGSDNVLNGSHVARIYKDAEGEKKKWKQDGALYAYQSMNISGEGDGSGVLTVNADNEGINSELHLTIQSGNLRIFSGDDGINTNEDGVSVTTINGGDVHIIAGLGAEGDGVDSNGWLVINGGTVIASANPAADAGLDSDMGSYVNGGTVVALGSTMDWAESDSEQVTMNLQFASYNNSGDAIVVTDQQGSVIFAYDPSDDEVLGSNVRRYMGAVVSSPAFRLDSIYHVYIGGELTGSEFEGVYDVSTVTAYEGGAQQMYTGTDVTRFRGGFGGFGGGRGIGGGRGMDFGQRGQKQGERDFEWKEGQRPEKPESGEMPEPPEGFVMPESGEMPEPPEGFVMPESGEMPEPPEGFVMPESGEMPEPPEGFVVPETGDAPEGGITIDVSAENPSSDFYTQDKVNAYSGVQAK